MRKFARVILILVAILLVIILAAGLYVKKGLPNVGPPAELKVEVTPARVERGKYLAISVAGCMICHSGRDLSLYGGPVMDRTLGKGGEVFGHEEGFPGEIYATNLTPYHLGKWTDGELFRAITTGESRDGRALFPIMNYPAYGKLDAEDIYSIIAFLRTLPSIPNDVAATTLDFPLNFIVNTMPKKAVMITRPDSTDAIAYGGYLVKMASCVDCHSKVNKGTIIAGTEFGGGRDFGPSAGKEVYSANITPDKETGIGNWSRELFIRSFKQYADSGYVAKPLAAGDRGTPMPWLAYASMKEQDLSAIYAYLHSLQPIHNDVKKMH